MAKVKMTIEKLASLMVDGFETLNRKVDGLTNDMTQVKRDIGEIKVDVKAHGKAVDKDAGMGNICTPRMVGFIA